MIIMVEGITKAGEDRTLGKYLGTQIWVHKIGYEKLGTKKFS